METTKELLEDHARYGGGTTELSVLGLALLSLQFVMLCVVLHI